MLNFNNNKIAQGLEDVGEELRRARQEKKLNPEVAAEKLSISAKYIRAMEAGDFSRLPSGIYRKNFLKEYALFLGLNPEPLMEICLKEQNQEPDSGQNKFFGRKTLKTFHFIAVPRIIRNLLTIVIVLSLVSYLGICVEKIVSPPELTIEYPQKDITTRENKIEIKGEVEKEARVMINGEMILIDSEGNFSKNINLKNGLNTISITAQKKYSRKNNLIRKIIVNS